MKQGKRSFSRLAVAIITMILTMSCVIVASAADNTSVGKAQKLTLGKKTTVNFDENFKDRYYKVSIPKKGVYKIYIYSDTVDSNECFWIGVYGSASDARHGKNNIWNETGLVNCNNSDTDYEYYKLNKGTYYICVQGWKEGYNTTAIKLERAANTFDTWLSDMFTYQQEGIWLSDLDNKEATLTSVKSSDSAVIKVEKDSWKENGKTHNNFWIVGKKAGKATITISGKTPEGKKCVVKKNLTVKTYPKQIKSLKVNGKKVNVANNKFEYVKNNDSSTKVKIDLQLKDGWKIQNVYSNVWNVNNGKEKELKGLKSALKKGKAINWSKSYTEFEVTVEMKKGNDTIEYHIRLSRGIA